MYLHDLENLENAPGAYAGLLKEMASNGGPISQIFYLFAYHPKATDHLMRFTQALMRGPAALSPGMRELIAAYTSACNQCDYCRNSHAAAAADLLGDEDLVSACISDLESAPLPEAEKALLRFVRKTTLEAYAVTEADIAVLKEFGWADDAIYDAITVCSLFNFYNRWVMASGVPTLPMDVHRQRGRSLARRGYQLHGDPAARPVESK